MKKLVLAGMLLAIVFTVGTTAGFDLAGGEANQPPVPSAEGLDPCNIAACDGGGTPQLHPSPPDLTPTCATLLRAMGAGHLNYTQVPLTRDLTPTCATLMRVMGAGHRNCTQFALTRALTPMCAMRCTTSMLASLRTCALA